MTEYPKYPDWLKSRVADVLAEDLEDEPVWSRWVIATHILDALGFHQATTPQNWESTLQREES